MVSRIKRQLRLGLCSQPPPRIQGLLSVGMSCPLGEATSWKKHIQRCPFPWRVPCKAATQRRVSFLSRGIWRPGHPTSDSGNAWFLCAFFLSNTYPVDLFLRLIWGYALMSICFVWNASQNEVFRHIPILLICAPDLPA